MCVGKVKRGLKIDEDGVLLRDREANDCGDGIPHIQDYEFVLTVQISNPFSSIHRRYDIRECSYTSDEVQYSISRLPRRCTLTVDPHPENPHNSIPTATPLNLIDWPPSALTTSRQITIEATPLEPASF